MAELKHPKPPSLGRFSKKRLNEEIDAWAGSEPADNYIEVILVSGSKTKKYVIPQGSLQIEDIKNRGVSNISGETVLDDITNYHKFIIMSDMGYSETV